MNTDLSKTVIRIIQDYCAEVSATLFMDKFSMAVAPKITSEILSNNKKFGELLKKNVDFFVANDLYVDSFCEELFKKINKELSFYQPQTLLDVLKRFKKKMENGHFQGFPKESTSEDTLRCTLSLFIEEETFLEARAASGRSDICIPSEKTIIETKIWRGEQYYNSGIPELCEYIEKNGYSQGYYVNFDYNLTENEIEKEKGHIFKLLHNNSTIYVIFIRMNDIAPSKKYKMR